MIGSVKSISPRSHTIFVNVVHASWCFSPGGRWQRTHWICGSVCREPQLRFNDKTWLDFHGHPHSEALHVVERFSRKDFGHMEVQVTIDDPVSIHEAVDGDLRTHVRGGHRDAREHL